MLIKNKDHQSFLWEKITLKPSPICNNSYPIREIQEALLLKATRIVTYFHLKIIYGTPKTYSQKIIFKSLPILGSKTTSDLPEKVEKGRLMKIKVRYNIKNIDINPPGCNTYHTKEE